MVQTTYGQITDEPADAGRSIGIHSADNVFGLAAGGGAVKVSTITVDTAANATAYTYSCGGGTVTMTSDASATKIEIAAGLEAAHNALAAAGSVSVAVSDGVDTVTITGRERGDDFALSESDANLSLAAVTAASDGTAIPFGLGCQRTAYTECGLPALGTAKVMTYTPTAVNLALYTLTITGDFSGDGNSETYTANYSGDASATVAEIVTGLVTNGNAILPANSVLLVDGTTVITATGEVAGFDFGMTGAGSLGAVITIATTTAAARDPFQGVSMKTQRVETATANGAEYAADDTVDVLANGEIWVELDSGQTPAVGDPVFCRASASGTEQLGAFRTDSDSGDAFSLTKCYWTHEAVTGLDGVTTIAGLMVRL